MKNRLFLCMVIGFFSYVTLSYSMMNNEPSVWGDLHKNSLSSSVSSHEQSFLSRNTYGERSDCLSCLPQTLLVTQPLKDQIVSSVFKGPYLSILPLFIKNDSYTSKFFEKAEVVFGLLSALKYNNLKTLSSAQAADLNPYATYMLTVLD